MKAVGFKENLPIEHDESLLDIHVDTPVATGRDLLVEVKAISVNPVDGKMRLQLSPPENTAHRILGWDAVGVVTAVGEDVSLFQPGDEVWYAGDVTRQGCNSEYHLVDERIVGRKPSTLSNAEAAALPLTSITAWELLFDRLSIPQDANSKDVVLLIIGGAGGVGSIATQLARQLTQATVIATASRPETHEWVKQRGAHHVIDHRQPLSEELKKLGIHEVTHVAGLTHTDTHFEEIVKCLKPQGKLGIIDLITHPREVTAMKMKSLSLHWEFMFTRAMFQTDDMIEQHHLLNNIAKMIEDGTLKTTLGKHYGAINATNLKRAQADIATHTAIGKIVLEGFDNRCATTLN